jgi:uncharacterized protein (TIGR03437 family)
MLRALFVSILLVAGSRAQSGTISVVSAASYRTVVAPDSLVSIFGTSLAHSTASATLDDNGNLPTELASTRVEFSGTAAALIFVSPTQINLVVPSGVATGTAAVAIISTDTNTARNTTAQIATSAPALFSSDASGTGPGAILNAVTFQPEPFLTVTPENGVDTRTRLAAYGTGFRNAKNVSATAIDSFGNRFTLVVEFAGAAPGFAGLDQLNFIVPAGVDGGGAVLLTVTTENSVSNTVTFLMNLLPVSQLRLASIALNPSAVNGGQTITATITLTGIARTGGFPVSLVSNNLSAQPPGFATVPTGVATLDVPIPTSNVVTVQIGTITAQAGGVSLSAPFEVDPQNQVQLASFSVVPTSTLGGRTLQATIGLTGTTPGGGVNVQITSDSPAARPAAVVSVPVGQSAASFQIPTSAVISPLPVTFSASFDRVTLTSQVTLLPPFTLAVTPNQATGGESVTGSITLADPAPPGGVTIALTSSDPVAARVPSFISIGTSQNFTSFNIPTAQTSAQRIVTITAIFQGLTARVDLTVNPTPPPTLSSLTISPNPITGGLRTQGTVTLAAPAPVGGILVTITSTALNIAQVPPVITVPQGVTAAIFSIQTFLVPFSQSATIIATAGGVTRSAVLTVQ